MSKKLIFLLFPAILFAQNLNLRLTTTAYMWQRQETPEISTNHLRAYQLAQLTLSKGNLSFHAFANLSNDFREKQTDDPRFRFYNFYLNWRNIFNRFNLKLGRFAVYSGVGVGTIDGAYINAKIFKFLSANVYGGFLMPGTPNQFGLLGNKANSIQPGKRMLSSMTPTIVLKNGKPFLILGSPGGSTIITSVLQVILNVIDFGMNIQEAVDAPRIHHQWYPDVVYYEKRGLPLDVIENLGKRGHKLVERRGFQGEVQAILIDENGVKYGAADPRGYGFAMGY